ncbi:MAG: histidine kinase [Lachnospiraceae bacterium]|nr:histidine kinase [Lachnospiraceae bacterium]
MKKQTISSFLSAAMTVICIFLGLDLFLICYFIVNDTNLVIVILTIMKCIVEIILLLINWRRIRPSISSLRKQYSKFSSGKTIVLETNPKTYMFLAEEVKLINRVNELVNRKQLLHETNKQAEYLALQNQINPHFLYNTLEAMRGDAIINKMYPLANVAKALSTYFRYTISNMQFLVPVEDELENITNYFLVQKYRFGERLKMEVHFLDNEEEIRKLLIPKLTLQPIVENSVYHGLEKMVDRGTISLTFDQTESNLLISIKDSGTGMDENTLSKLNNSLNDTPFKSNENDGRFSDKTNHSGIALKNVSRRIKLFFGDKYGIYVYSTQNVGTNVKITLPRQELNKTEV